MDEELPSRLLEHEFLHRRPPRSAWRFDFGSSFADKHIAEKRNLTPEDLLSTFTEFAAVSVSHLIRDYIPILNEITTLIASSGGVRNKALMERIRVNLPPGAVRKSSFEVEHRLTNGGKLSAEGFETRV